MNNPMMRINQKTLQESVRRVTPGLPYMTELCMISDLPEKCFPWHWHGEVEMFYVMEGVHEYHVPGGAHVFRAGEAGFVNANVLHMTRGIDDEPVTQQEHLFLPAFIAGPAAGDIEMKYIRPVLRASGLEIFRFRDAERAIELMHRAHRIYAAGAEGFEIRVRALMSELWLALYEETRELHGGNPPANADDERIKRMLSYISEHYAEHIVLADIARAGLVGERECFRIFKRSLGMTPMECLTGQRITRAAEFLRTTDQPVLDIALACGFCSSSYFGKIFRERMGVTPREYRAAQ